MPTKSTLPTPLPDFRLLFELAPALYLVLTADLMIVAASDTYLRATKTNREDILGRGVFDVFPDDPDDPIATGVRNSRASFERVVKGRVSDVMAVQQHAIRRPEPEGGGFEERYWSPVNSPVLGPNGEVAYIIHRVEDVTEFVRLRTRGIEQDTFAQELRTRGEQMEAEVFLRAQQVQETNRQLRGVNEELARLRADLERRVQERTAELRDSEERFRLLVDGVKDYAIFLLDPHGNVQTWNAGAERIKGYTAEEIVGQSFCRFYAPEDVVSGKPGRELNTALAEGRYEEEGVRIRKDGARFWAAITITPLHDSARTHVGFVEIIRDIAERKRAEQQLRESEERFRLLVEGVDGHAIFMLDPHGNIQTWTHGTELIEGYRAEEIIGKPFSQLFTRDNIESGRPLQELQEAAANGKVTVEGWRVRKDGTRFWANGSVSALYGGDGGVRGFAKIIRDMTERHRTAELLQSVLDHTLDGIISIDDQGTISLFSRAAERIFNYLASEVLGQNVKMLMPEADQSEHDRYLATYLRTGEAKIIGIGREVEGRRKDGSTFPLDLAVTEFELDRHRLFLANVRDISAQKEMEAQLRQAQKMEAVGQLAGGVAHDFNNLLTIISGHSEILLSRMASNDPMRRSIQSISQAGEHAASLTRQVLAFSRQTVMEPKVVDVNAAVRETEMMLRRLLGEDIVLTTVLEPHISRVKLDPSLLTQVLMNLSVNARDAMPKGGTLTLETRNVDLDQTYADTHVDVRAGRYVMVAVSDTGGGMTPETQVRIFEPFFTTKGVGKGTGLGLSVVHGIVKQSGGHIEVHSELNRGATFRFYFPAVEAPADAAMLSDREAGARGTETVLLVEDEGGVRDLAFLVLQTHGYTVLAARDGTDALSVADTHRRPIDLLVTDVVMPGMDGRQVAEALQPRFPQMKVLFTSGYTDDAVAQHGIVQAEVAFLQKPYLPQALARKVRQVLDQP